MSYSFRDRTIINSSTATGFFSSANVITSSDFNALSINTDGFQGTVSGYASAGYNGTSYFNVIDKFPFATASTNATDVGDLSVTRGSLGSGQSSSVSGYTSGGTFFSPTPTITYYNVIDKFPFASNANATDVGDLVTDRYAHTGHNSYTHGFVAAGIDLTPATVRLFSIERFPFAINANATNVGAMSNQIARQNAGGHSSDTTGYISGGTTPPHPPGFNTTEIHGFPFSSDSFNTVNFGFLSLSTQSSIPNSSATHGYSSGGYSGPSIVNGIYKFPFAQSGIITSTVGNLGSTLDRSSGSGINSSTHAYMAGGLRASAVNIIDRFPFAADGVSVDVGDLTLTATDTAGHQN